jgi:hypothetical protein
MCPRSEGNCVPVGGLECSPAACLAVSVSASVIPMAKGGRYDMIRCCNRAPQRAVVMWSPSREQPSRRDLASAFAHPNLREPLTVNASAPASKSSHRRAIALPATLDFSECSAENGREGIACIVALIPPLRSAALRLVPLVPLDALSSAPIAPCLDHGRGSRQPARSGLLCHL